MELDGTGVDVTVINPGTITGTNFRTNSMIPMEENATPNWSTCTVEECTKHTMYAADRRLRDMVINRTVMPLTLAIH